MLHCIVIICNKRLIQCLGDIVFRHCDLSWLSAYATFLKKMFFPRGSAVPWGIVFRHCDLSWLSAYATFLKKMFFPRGSAVPWGIVFPHCGLSWLSPYATFLKKMFFPRGSASPSFEIFYMLGRYTCTCRQIWTTIIDWWPFVLIH